jgi:hypothetical protein
MINNITLPVDMEIPNRRRDTTKPENVRWLLRNLGVQNQDHPRFEIVCTVLKNLTKSTT